MLWPILIFLFVFGTIIGSFLNVLILRLPAKEKMTGRSHCASCQHQLEAKDLVPVVSFALLGGRCRYCRKSISRRYLYIELMTGLLFAMAFFSSGLQYSLPNLSGLQVVELVRMFFIISVLVVIFMIDFEHFLILDEVLVTSTILLFAINIAVDYFGHYTFSDSYAVAGLVSGLGVFLFFGCIYLFSDGRWIGFGDVKMAWLLGLISPFPFIFLNIFLAFMVGAIVGVILLATRQKKLSSEVPLGAFLAISSIITLFYGAPIIDLYFRLIGWR